MDENLLYALREEERKDLAYTATIMRRPRCVCCNEHIFTESYLDLAPFGGSGYACWECVEAHTGDSWRWDDD